jgi:uncharacterized protein (UPF0261 family)
VAEQSYEAITCEQGHNGSIIVISTHGQRNEGSGVRTAKALKKLIEETGARKVLIDLSPGEFQHREPETMFSGATKIANMIPRSRVALVGDMSGVAVVLLQQSLESAGHSVLIVDDMSSAMTWLDAA